MFKNNFFNKKSKGQHIVELALMMPFFIIAFSYAFQIMVETYAKYKFSYIFTNAIRVAIDNQPVFKRKNDAASYNIREEIENSVKRVFETGNSSFTDVQVGTISTPKTFYIMGAFQYRTRMLFLGEGGKEYFYFTVPINSAFVKPLVLDYSKSDIDDYFDKYYSLTGRKYTEDTPNEAMFNMGG